MIRSPLFIVFEGIDGSGKSTLSSMLFSYLHSNNISTVCLMEPTDGRWGLEIRNMLKGDIILAADEQLRLFLLDREDDVLKNIIPALKSNCTIIMDRYYYSNAAYQGAMGLSPEYILNENRERNFPEPDRVYFIDVSPEVAIQRISIRNEKGGREIFEKKLFLQRVRDIYLSIADDRFLIIDGSETITEVFNVIKKDISDNYFSDGED